MASNPRHDTADAFMELLGAVTVAAMRLDRMLPPIFAELLIEVAAAAKRPVGCSTHLWGAVIRGGGGRNEGGQDTAPALGECI